MELRIFWCHPRLMDYRKGLFQQMSRIYSIRFLFQLPSEIDQDFDRIYTKKQKIISAMRLIPLEDIRILYKGIKWSNVYISSFIWSTYTILGLAIAKILGKRVIVWEEINIICTDLKSKLKYILARLLFRYIDAYFVLGEIHKKKLIQLGAVSDKIFVANEYPGQTYHTVLPQPISLPFNNETDIILFLGRLIEIKGVEYLLKAFSMLEKTRHDAALLIAGDGHLRQELERISASLGIKNIFFAGEILNVNQKAYIFQRSRMVVVPSITYQNQREGGPMVVLEALSAGKPVIGTDALGSCKAFIQNGINGYLVPEKNVDALLEKMEAVLETTHISMDQVLSSFKKINGYEHQSKKLQEAINFATRHEAD